MGNCLLSVSMCPETNLHRYPWCTVALCLVMDWDPVQGVPPSSPVLQALLGPCAVRLL